MDLDDFGGSFCGAGKYPLINAIKTGIERRISMADIEPAPDTDVRNAIGGSGGNGVGGGGAGNGGSGGNGGGNSGGSGTGGGGVNGGNGGGGGGFLIPDANDNGIGGGWSSGGAGGGEDKIWLFTLASTSVWTK